MRALLVFIIATYLNYSLAGERDQITCSDIKENVTYVPILNWFGTDKERDFDVYFYLSTNRKKEPEQIRLDSWRWVSENGFNMSKKTFIITHGWMSGGQEPWCMHLKDALLEARDSNVIMVDWSGGSNLLNYVSAARNTILVSDRIFKSLQKLRAEFLHLNPGAWSDKILGNHLHFIGHSLGAQISGQTAHVLKNDDFWKVERVTGLDPANPCFSNIDPSLRIDRKHADFVDVYHTQIGREFTDGLGMTDTVGHVDFYLNGGFIQPECQGGVSMFKDLLFGYSNMIDFVGDSIKLTEMVCSHKLATEFFIAALNNAKVGGCTFPVYQWDGSYSDAQKSIKLYVSGSTCNDCPKMGMDAVNGKRRGIFLVLTGSERSYCKFDKKDLEVIVSGMEKLTKMKSIFDYHRPEGNSRLVNTLKWLKNYFKPMSIPQRLRFIYNSLYE